MSEKKWIKQDQGGDFFKWDTPGQELEGIWQGTRPGKFGDLGKIATTSALVVFPIHTALAYLIEDLEVGNEVKIVYTGKVANPKTGRVYKSFDLYRAGSEPDDIPF